MKTIYIPKGETVRYDRLYADRIIVNGCLHVEHGLDAKTIGGSGTIHAGKVSADTIRIGCLDACSVMCKRLLASRVDAPEIFASESVVVSCVLSAILVETRKLTVALCEAEEVKAAEVVNVPARRWSVFGILLVSTLQTLWFSAMNALSHSEVMDADYEPVEPAPAEDTTHAEAAEPTEDASPAEEAAPKEEPVDEELNRIVGMFKLAREEGYTLRLIPGTPEENAPVFDLEAGKIVLPAA